MKKLILATAVLCFFASCKDSGTADNSQNEKNLENNKKVFQAIQTGDAAVIDSLIASDAVDHQGPNGMDIKGPDSVRHMLTDMHNHMKDFKLSLITDAANGDYIFSLAHFEGTTTDAGMGMPAGTKMDEKEVDVVKLKDGKMIEHWGFVDPAAMMKHMKDMPMNNPMDNKMNNKMDSSKMKK